MTVTLDPTVSGVASNAYSDVASAVAYLSTQLYGSSFVDEPNEDKQAQALIEATYIIDLEQYQGDQTVLAQRLKWPRTYVLQPFDPGIVVPPGAIPPGGFVPMPRYYDSTIIIRPVFEGCCELANILIASGTDLFGDDPTLQIHREQIGQLSTEYVDTIRRVRGVWRYPKLASRLAPLVLAARQTKVRRG